MTTMNINPRGVVSFLLKQMLPTKQRRYAIRWIKSLQRDYMLATPSPWIAFDAIDYLASAVRPGSRVFEYGSGGSTLYWLSLGAECVSIEHDPEWYALMLPRLESLSGIDYRLVVSAPANSDDCRDIADPTCYRSASSGNLYKNYTAQINSFADQFFDLVVVDGRARPSCIMHGARKVKPGGLLVLDNADRAYYLAQTRQFLDGFACLEFIGAAPGLYEFTQTNIYIRAS